MRKCFTMCIGRYLVKSCQSSGNKGEEVIVPGSCDMKVAFLTQLFRTSVMLSTCLCLAHDTVFSKKGGGEMEKSRWSQHQCQWIMVNMTEDKYSIHVI